MPEQTTAAVPSHTPGMTLSILIHLSGFTVQQVATHLGVTKSTVSRWSAKDLKLPPGTLQPLAAFIHREVEEIMPLVIVSRGRAKPRKAQSKPSPSHSAIA